MSVLIQYPDGKTGVVSEAVAEILEKRPGHKLIKDVKKPKAENPEVDK